MNIKQNQVEILGEGKVKWQDGTPWMCSLIPTAVSSYTRTATLLQSNWPTGGGSSSQLTRLGQSDASNAVRVN